ncbi:MAG: hypothetical protein WCW36_01250 [Candidatus Paceibacterota bacterium]|jgi:hypothetical protein
MAITLAWPQSGSFVPLPAVIVYEPGGSAKWKAPVASELPIINGVLEPARRTVTVVAYGLSAHRGSGGSRSTGHVGPSDTVPRTPESYGKMPFALPAVVVAVAVAVPVFVAVVVGHGANSQFGPTRPTVEPSRQNFASVVHATPPLRGGASRDRITQSAPASTTASPSMMRIYSFML